jgi:hypothetical protein
MRKRDVIRNILVGWGLVVLSVLFTLASLAYIEAFRALPR